MLVGRVDLLVELIASGFSGGRGGARLLQIGLHRDPDRIDVGELFVDLEMILLVENAFLGGQLRVDLFDSLAARLIAGQQLGPFRAQLHYLRLQLLQREVLNRMGFLLNPLRRAAQLRLEGCYLLLAS